MDKKLSLEEVRVLGVLIEKEILTPESYPMSVNSIRIACNQKTSREPVLDLDESLIHRALKGLRDKTLVMFRSGQNSRVSKFEHLFPSIYRTNPKETILMCLLMLRGPQTPGELKTRSQSLIEFTHLDDVMATLQNLQQRETPLIQVLEKRPGQKEVRYIHLLGEEPLEDGPSESLLNLPYIGSPPGLENPSVLTSTSLAESEILELKSEVKKLKLELEALKNDFEQFKEQF